MSIPQILSNDIVEKIQVDKDMQIQESIEVIDDMNYKPKKNRKIYNDEILPKF